MSEIIPAILPESTEDLQEKLKLIPEEVSIVHIDVIDEKIYTDPTVDFEIHLMIENPDDVIDEWIKAGAKRALVHKLSDKIRALRPGIQVGLAVELQTPLTDIYSQLEEVDYVQLMSIEKIGAQGHKFEPEVFEKISEIQTKYPDMLIAVDGGVNLENAGDLLAVGVDRLVVGSAIFDTKDPLGAYIKFLEVLH